MKNSIKEHYCKGDVIVFAFPYTDSQDAKPRPALIIAVSGQNLTAIYISTKTGRKHEVLLEKKNFCCGNLTNNPSFIHYDKIVTINKNLVTSIIGKIKDEKLEEVINKLINYLKEPKVEEVKSKAVVRLKQSSKYSI